MTARASALVLALVLAGAESTTRLFQASQVVDILSPIQAVLPLDVNGDGQKDVLFAVAPQSRAASVNRSLYYSLQEPNRTFGPPTPCALMNVHAMASGDVDGDGVDDVAVVDDASGVVAVFLLRPRFTAAGSDGSVAHAAVFTRVDVDSEYVAAYSVAVSDVDGDGRADVVACGG